MTEAELTARITLDMRSLVGLGLALPEGLKTFTELAQDVRTLPGPPAEDQGIPVLLLNGPRWIPQRSAPAALLNLRSLRLNLLANSFC